MATARPICRALLIATILTITFGSVFVAAQDPAGAWKLNEGSGTTAFDSAGGSHTGFLSGGVNWTNSVGTWAISGNTSRKGYVTIPPIDLTGTKAVSVAFWVKRTYTTNGGMLFGAGRNYLQADTGFALLPDDAACHGIQAVLHGNEGTTANCYSQPSSGVWHHLAIVYDKSQTGGNAVVLYVDGVLENPSWNLSSATNTNNFGNDPIYLLSQGGASQFSSGTISDFRIYASPLNGEQVAQIYKDSKLASPTAINYVQGNYADPQSPQSTVRVPFNSAQNAGDLNVVVVGWKDSRTTVRQIADSKGNVYTRAVGPTVINGAASQSIYYAKNIVAAGAGTNTVTVSFSASARNPDVRILEYSGADTNNPVDVTAANTGNSRTSNSGTGRTTNANDLIFGADTALSLTSGPGSGFTKRLLTSPQSNIAEDQVVSATGDYSASAPIMPSARWIMQMVAFRTPGAPTLVSISVTPTNPSISVGAHQQFTATGTYSDGSHQDLTNSATWTSSAISIATISSTGLATGVAAGSTTIQAASGSINGTTNLTVTGAASFTISANPSSVSVMQGMQGTSTITTVVNNGFNSAITLSASGMPAGTTVTFTPATIPAPGSGSSLMTITVAASTPMGTYPITVTGSGGGVYQTTTVNVTVTALVALSWTASQSPGTAGYNIYRSTTSGGPYVKINTSLDPNTTYNDQVVQDGYTYYYVTTAVSSQGTESVYSNEATATVP